MIVKDVLKMVAKILGIKINLFKPQTKFDGKIMKERQVLISLEEKRGWCESGIILAAKQRRNVKDNLVISMETKPTSVANLFAFCST